MSRSAVAASGKPSKREQTRQKVIDAAIDCIYEEGFNAAHTNRICERAGVSWGVLQYHFGDKDGLLQAVLDNIFTDFTNTLASADLNEGSLKQRVQLLIELIWSLVSKPEYRVSMAILRNAGKSNDSAIDDERLVMLWAEETAQLWETVFKDLVDKPVKSETAKRILFATLRGFADELNPRGHTTKKQLQKEFSALADAITFLLCQ